MSTSRENLPLRDYWAKSATNSNSVGESFTGHTANVVSRLFDFCRIYPELSNLVGEPQFWQLAFWSCVLHDAGKLASGFQARLREPSKKWPHRHEVLSLAFVDWALGDFSELERTWIAAGIAYHHKDHQLIRTKYPFLFDDDDVDLFESLVAEIDGDCSEQVARWLTEEVPKWAVRWNLPGEFVPAKLSTDAANDFKLRGANRIRSSLKRLSGLVLKTEMDSGTSRRLGVALRGIVILSDHSASAHIRPRTQLGSGADAIKELGFIERTELYEHQQACIGDTRHLVLEAPTGSGKTESAMLWALSATAGRVLYLLPYQASLNAMKSRLENRFPGNVALQHSRSLQALFRGLLDKGYSPTQSVVAAKRERSLARLHHHCLRVMTPYQLLRGMFRLKGYESMITDCAQASIICDEIHAYEPKRLGMILATMEYFQTDWGCRFFVLSATMPSILRELISSTLLGPVHVRATPELFNAFTRHRLNLVDINVRSPQLHAQIESLVRNGHSTLVVCNRVSVAIEVYEALALLFSKNAIPVELLHGRFNSRDRFAKEQTLLTSMGTRARKQDSIPVVMVATQVVEVSLDIDFDTIFTEIAPLESLLQRFGRVNRGRQKSIADVFVLTQPQDGQYVYDDRFISSVLPVLERLDGQNIEEEKVSSWLDEIYAGPAGADWLVDVENSRNEFRSICISSLRPFDSSPELADRFDSMFDGTEVLPETLLAEYDAAEDPLLNSELFVPVSERQLQQLKRRKLAVWDSERCMWITSADYDSKYGLKLN